MGAASEMVRDLEPHQRIACQVTRQTVADCGGWHTSEAIRAEARAVIKIFPRYYETAEAVRRCLASAQV